MAFEYDAQLSRKCVDSWVDCYQSYHRMEHKFHREGFGPYILHLVDNKSLTDIGVSVSDTIRLKNGAPIWWNSPEAKHKAPSDPVSSNAPTTKKICFEKRWLDGTGAATYIGSGLAAKDPPGPTVVEEGMPPPADHKWFYLCDVHNEMLLVPANFAPILELDADDDDSQF